MAFNWNFRRQPDLTNYIGTQVDPYNASRIASENMQGYRPNAAFTPGTPAEQAAAAMQGYTQNPQKGQFNVPNDMHGGTGQPDLEGYGESLQAASDAAAQAQAQQQVALQKQQRIKEIEAEIAEIEQRMAERKRGMSANEDALNTQLAAIEARKINQKDPTSIWRWKAQMDENRRIANAQNKADNTAKANAMIEIANDLDSIIVDDKMTSQDQKAYLSKLSNMKTLGEKAGVPKSVIDNINAKIKEVKGENETNSEEQSSLEYKKGTKGENADKAADELLAKPDLTQGDIVKFKRDNPNVSDEKLLELNKKHNELIDRDKKIAYKKKRDAYIADYERENGKVSDAVRATLERLYDKEHKKG